MVFFSSAGSDSPYFSTKVTVSSRKHLTVCTRIMQHFKIAKHPLIFEVSEVCLCLPRRDRY